VYLAPASGGFSAPQQYTTLIFLCRSPFIPFSLSGYTTLSEDMSGKDIVVLNVGGKKFETTWNTLCKYKSKLSQAVENELK
jgi:hypothetical protein